MKLPKALLGAILIGITVQTVSSCKKDKELIYSNQVKKNVEKVRVYDSCPACGLG
jgi:hypothetical protein